MNNQNPMDRIKYMEEKYDNVLDAVSELDSALEKFNEIIPEMEELMSYYDSKLWINDYEADSRGEIPSDLKRGVLSEDGIYNLLTDYQRLKELIRYKEINNKVIVTERLILRPWEESDAESLYMYAKDPAVGPIAGWPPHTSIENSLEIIDNVLSKGETYAVCLKDDNVAIGSIGLFYPAQSYTKIDKTEMEIGYWIGVPFWGKGYIPEAIRALQKRAFEDLSCNAMWCGYYDGNEKSKRCQEKCGFRYHHTEENKPCELMGDIRTEHYTRITIDEWEKNQK